MSLKARGKLRPGQPDAKQFAEQLRRAQAMNCPTEYGNNGQAFVHNSTNKPITAYRFNKFKNMQKMRGINLGETSGITHKDEQFAEKMR